MPITEAEKIWKDGELVDWADANVHASPLLRTRTWRSEPHAHPAGEVSVRLTATL